MVNEIAFEFRNIPHVGFVLAFVVLVVGHTGNLLLSSLSSFVHPLRLTFVEGFEPERVRVSVTARKIEDEPESP